MNAHSVSPPAAAGPTRTERDSFGPIEVPAQALWGAQTARSLRFFDIGGPLMPLPMIHAMAWIKWAAAEVNQQLAGLDAVRGQAIATAARAVAEGRHDEAFPLSVWQTGSGTQSHMNVNEVVATLANQGLQAQGHARLRVDAHDDVNRGQSSNDVVPSALHIALACQARAELMPALQGLHRALADKALAWRSLVKVGRTHLQDATPVTLGQEFGAYAAQLAQGRRRLLQALAGLQALALGGTAVGTGINTHPRFGAEVAARLAAHLGLVLAPAPNLFAAMAGQEAVVALHGALRGLAITLAKMAGDIRLMGSGPRAGLGELRLPANEPGSSIMPGKVNPTQVEALLMVCAQVVGHDVAIGLAAAQGQFELNTWQPLIALDALESVALLAGAMRSFTQHCVLGLQADEARLAEQLQRSLMLVTALSPHIGYAGAAQVAQRAQADGSSLREAALALGAVSAEQFDAWVDPRQMLGPPQVD